MFLNAVQISNALVMVGRFEQRMKTICDELMVKIQRQS